MKNRKSAVRRGFTILMAFIILSAVLVISAFADSSDEVKYRVQSKPTYHVSYGYTFADAVQDESGKVVNAYGETISGVWSSDINVSENYHFTTFTEYTATFVSTDPENVVTITDTAIIYVRPTLPTVAVTADVTEQSIGKTVVLSISAAHPEYPEFTDGLPTAFDIQVALPGGAFTTVAENYQGSSYTYTLPQDVDISSGGTIDFKVTSREVAGKYKSWTSDTVSVTPLEKEQVDGGLIDFSVENITYGEYISPEVEFNGAKEGEGAWTYFYSTDRGSTYSALIPDSTVLNANSALNYYIIKARYEDNTKWCESTKELHVAKAEIGIEFGVSDITKVYDGGTDVVLPSGYTYSYTFTGVTGVMPELNTSKLKYTYTDKNAGVNKEILISGIALADSTNYIISSTATAVGASITVRTATVTPDVGQGKVYDGIGSENETYKYGIDGVLDADVATVVGSLSREEGSDAGRYQFSIGTIKDSVGNYEFLLASGEHYYTVSPKNIAGAEIVLGRELEYTGYEQEQTVASVTVDGLTVTYTLSGNLQTDAGKYTLTVTGTGNFTGTATKDYTIKGIGISGATVNLVGSLTYNGKEQTQQIEVIIDGVANPVYEVSGNTATDAGTYTLTVTGTENFSGTITVEWTIAKKDISDADITLGESLTYNGKEQTQSVTSVMIDGLLVTFGIEGNKETNAGDYTLTVIGEGNFSGVAVCDWSIAKKDISGAGVTLVESLIYNGKEQAQNVEVTVDGISATFTLSGNVATDAGDYTLTAEGSGNFCGQVSADFTIARKNIAGAVITPTETLVYNGREQTQNVEVTVDGISAAFTVSGNVGTNAGDYTLTVEGSGNFEGQASAIFTIAKRDIADAVIELTNSIIYNGLEQTQNITVTLDGFADLTYTVSGNTASSAGYHTLTVTGTGNFGGVATKEWMIIGTDISDAVITLIGSLTYNGRIQTQRVSVSLDGYDDLTYEVIGNRNINAGNYILTVRGTGNFSGECKISYKIAKKNITGAEIILEASPAYDGETKTQIVRYVLIDGVSATYSVAGNTATEIGTYTLTVSATDNFTGTASAEWKLVPNTSKIDGLTTDNVTSDAKDDIEWIKNSIKSDSAKTEWIAVTEKCDELLSKIFEVEENVAKVIDAIGAYDISSVKSSDVADVNLCIADIDTLLSSANLASSERTALEEAKATANSYIAKVASVAAEVERLKAVLDSYSEDTVKSTDKAVIESLHADVEAVLASSNLAEEERSDVELLLEGTNALRARISDITGRITAVITTLDSYSAETVKSSDKAKLEAIVSDIDTLLLTDNLTADERAALISARPEALSLLEVINANAADVNKLREELMKFDESTVKSSDKEEIEAILSNAKSILSGENHTDEEKDILEGLIDTAEVLIDKIEEISADLGSVIEGINSYSESTVKSTDKESVAALLLAADRLLLTNNLTEGERAELEEAKAYAEKLLSTVDAALNSSTALKNSIFSYGMNTVKSSDKTNIEAVMAEIDSLLSGGNLTDGEKTDLRAAVEYTNALLGRIDEVSASVADVGSKLSEYDINTVKSTDKSDIEAIITDISALLSTDNLTDAEREALVAENATAKALTERIKAAFDAAHTDDITASYEITDEILKLADKALLLAAMDDYEAALSLYLGNYTDNQAKSINSDLDRIEALLAVINKVEDVQDLINALPDPSTVSPDSTKAQNAINIAKEKYNALTSSEQSLVDRTRLDSVMAAITAYKVIEGNGSSITEGDSSILVFKTNAPKNKFSEFKINGAALDKSSYIVESDGSVVIKPDHLDTLKPGTYNFTIVYLDGRADGSFTVQARSYTWVWLAIIVAAAGVIGASTYAIVNRKNRDENY